ncbi:hypothetical protein E1B28_009796 [Marasmius oreades]|uniref:BZIP domain-containing protein n=1 Tax=Marasmius oreades TaxID=181124 RepID=A0A9P7RVY3_9AGAR|nr:uncharacterized protein E1B28_009796 [Marasmius oreades]KAG7090702.1 hypothetical protein E1B28_009796 [Marasmius oreades]
MNSYPNTSSLFDLSQPSTFAQLPDDDFLALLQKQFPGQSQNNHLFGGFDHAVNPQNLSQFTLPTMSPSSEDTSPSPPSLNKDDHKKQGSEEAEEVVESALKRKASDDDLDDEPSLKNQHTGASPSSSRKGTSTKRKASGPDESKALKRKEQNRAAQRAFRERKEKHVRDLEDKVAASEAKNDALASENENLRDLLTRLQSENVALRQQASSSSFTFTVPKSTTTTTPAKSPQYLTDNSVFSTLPRAMYPSPDPNHLNNPVDTTSLMSFDPNVLNLIDENAQQTATDGAMQMDFEFGNGNSNKEPSTSWLPSNLTTLSTNPAYFSLANMFESPPPASSSAAPVSTSNNEQSSFSFDLNSLAAWPSSDVGTLDDLFGGYINPQPPMDVDALLRDSTSSISPVVHHNKFSPSTSASSSPASHASEPSIFSTREGSSSDSEIGHDESHCPKTREEALQRIAAEGSSPFVKESPSSHEKYLEGGNAHGPSMFVDSEVESNIMQSITCQPGRTTFPSTERNEENVEVLTAWRSIRADPNFKIQECDMTKLCSEFASKARCDGSRVVLEPSGVKHIRESLTRKH